MKLIIGLGTGRCGTSSLSLLFNSQKDSYFTHEFIPHLPWNFNAFTLLDRLEELKKFKGNYIGDVALYYLPYVRFILSVEPKTKFICLERNREKVIKSFLSICKERDMWTNDPNRTVTPIEISFPKYPISDKKLAIGMYWDEYFELAHQLEKEFPNNFKIFQIEKLNSKEGVKEILDFAGFENPILETSLKISHINPISKKNQKFGKEHLIHYSEEFFDDLVGL